MTSAKPVGTYASYTAAILDKLGSGMSRGVIARELGLTTSVVAALISSAARHGRSAGRAAGHRRPVGQISLNYDVARQLRPHARMRGTTVLALAQQLVETVVTAGLVDAVLDDRSDA